MKLYLNEFETFPAHKLLKGDSDKLELEFDPVHRVRDVELELDIQKSGEEFFCQGKVRASINLECSRCLREFDKELVSETDFIICSKELHEKNKDVLDNEVYIYFQRTDLRADLTSIVSQEIILAISMKPLCSEDCRGLCSKCGINLNEKSCTCSDNQIDTRWEGLKKLSGLTMKKRNITDASSKTKTLPNSR